MLINESDVDKVKANDYIVIKANPLGITYSAEQYKVSGGRGKACKLFKQPIKA
jgi:hypothetical protein